MFDLDFWQEIWATITRNKLRSILTGFGVFWGIFMLTILIGVGNAFEGGLMKGVNGFASNSCFFWANLTSEPYKGFRKDRLWNMNNRDLVLIREKSRAVEYISPTIFGSNSAGKNIVAGQKSGSFNTRGVYPDFFHVEQQNILGGRLFNQMDIEGYRKVCIIGKEVSQTLFPSHKAAMGQYIKVNGIYFQVVGVVNPKSDISMGPSSIEATVLLPFSTMQRAFNQGDIIRALGCTAKPGYSASMVEQEVKDILKAAHEISPTDEKAVGSFNIESQFQIFQNLFLGVNTLIWIVGLGALFSGIIGISNIMLVTVRERTREIGIRRALGANPATIVKQILSESFLLTTISGLAGFLAAVGIIQAVQTLMLGGLGKDTFFIPPFISFNTAMVSIIVLLLSGGIAGLMPALRALSIKAIDAIRDE